MIIRIIQFLVATALAGCAQPGAYQRPVYIPPSYTTPIANWPMLGTQPAPRVMPAPSQAPNAFWTGRQAPAQSVTGMPGWQCEYNYAGRTFVGMFQGSCPPSIRGAMTPRRTA